MRDGGPVAVPAVGRGGAAAVEGERCAVDFQLGAHSVRREGRRHEREHQAQHEQDAQKFLSHTISPFSIKWVLKRIPSPPRKWQAFLHNFLFIVQDFFVQHKTGAPIWERRSSACPKTS